MSLAHAFGHQLGLPQTPNLAPTIFVIDDDFSVRNSLETLILSEGWQVETFASAQEFLARPRPLVPSCLILVRSVVDSNSLEEQKRIARERAEVPIIVISRYGDVVTSVAAMKAGAVDFLVMPFSNEVLLDGIRETFERSRLSLQREMKISTFRHCYALLSCRERQVMALVVSGFLNKQVGGELGISEITVKAHRRHLMQKMRANSLPDLVRMAAELEPARQAARLV